MIDDRICVNYVSTCSQGSMRLLLAEDEKKLGNSLMRVLETEGYVVDWVLDGEDVLKKAFEEDYDLVLLDVGLPTINGFEVLAELKDATPQLPVLMLTARDAIEDRVAGLDLGADDYVVKPFSIDELLARIRTATRKYTEHATALLACGHLTLDSTKKIVAWKNSLISLSPREYSLLAYLMIHRGEIVSKQRLIDQVWGEEVDPFSKVVDVYIGYLRKKFRKHSSKLALRLATVKGMGYTLNCND